MFDRRRFLVIEARNASLCGCESMNLLESDDVKNALCNPFMPDIDPDREYKGLQWRQASPYQKIGASSSDFR